MKRNEEQPETETLRASCAAAGSASRWRSCAKWPRTPGYLDITQSTDEHDTKEQAEAVCRILRRVGFGGERKVFPLEVWTEEILQQNTEDQRP